MAQNITLHVEDMVAAAEREIETLPVAEAIRVHGALHCPRGMLEFWLDPASKYHKPAFAADGKFVFFCTAGSRSALAAQTAQRMGLKPVAHIAGGFGAWRSAGGPVDTE